MVSNRIISRHVGDPPLDEGASRRIDKGPLYSSSDVLDLLNKFGDQAIIAWTKKASKDMQKLSLCTQDLRELIELAIQHVDQFKGSQWCLQGTNGPWAACDAYSVVRTESHPYKEMDVEYYVKFAIAKTESVLLVASCHLSYAFGGFNE